jgi:hypothetical protein
MQTGDNIELSGVWRPVGEGNRCYCDAVRDQAPPIIEVALEIYHLKAAARGGGVDNVKPIRPRIRTANGQKYSITLNVIGGLHTRVSACDHLISLPSCGIISFLSSPPFNAPCSSSGVDCWKAGISV